MSAYAFIKCGSICQGMSCIHMYTYCIHTHACVYIYMYILYTHAPTFTYTRTTHISIPQYVCVCVYAYTYSWPQVRTGIHLHTCMCTGWRRLIESSNLQIIFHKRATKYRSLLPKMTYKDKGSYESSPPCRHIHVYTYLVFLADRSPPIQ